MKSGGGHAKGAQFERDICRQLSLWWTGGSRDDVFWRTPQSGGRATTRRKGGKETYGHYGDILAVDPIGIPLLKFMTFELKCGYKGTSPMDLMDGGPNSLWCRWIRNIQHVAHDAKSRYWGLIVKRYGKRVIFCRPSDVQLHCGGSVDVNNSYIHICHHEFGDIDVVLLEDFFSDVRPEAIG